MKKTLIGGVLLIAALLLGAYYYTGMRAEDELRAELSQFNLLLSQQMTDSGVVSLSLKDYQRGVFSSKADLMLSMKMDIPQTQKRPSMKLPELSWGVSLNIAHGPFIFSRQRVGMAAVTAQISIPNNMKAMAKMMLEDKSQFPSFMLDLFLNFDGSGTFEMNVPKFSLYPRGKQGQFSWNGMTATYHFSKDLQKIHGKSVLNGMNFSNRNVKGHMDTLTMDYLLHYSPLGIWLGDVSLNLPGIHVSANNTPIFELSDASFNSGASLKANKFVDSILKSTFKQLKVMNQAYGPAALNFMFTNLNGPVLKTLQEKVDKIKRQTPDVKARQAKFLELLPLASQLLNQGAKASLQTFSLKMPSGMIKANGSISFEKGMVVKNPQELPKYLMANLHVTLPQSLLKTMLVSKVRKKLIMQQMERRLNQIGSSEHKDTTSDKTDTQSSDTSSSDQSTEQASSDKKFQSMSTDEINQLAKDKVTKQLNKLVQNKVLIESDGAYKIDLMFNKGVLKINDKIFTKEMLKQ